MGEYQRFVSYLYEYQKDRKEKNAGFVRVNMRGGQTKLCVGLKVLEGEGQALLLGVGKRPVLLGSVRHKAGDGGETFLMRSSDVRGSGAPFSDFSGLRVETPAGSVYKTFWDDRMAAVKEVAHAKEMGPQPDMAEIIETVETKKAEPLTENAMGQENMGDPADSGNGIRLSEIVPEAIDSAEPEFGTQMSEAVSDAIASAVPKYGTQESDTAPDAMAPAASLSGIRVSEAVSNGESREEEWQATEENGTVAEAYPEELTASVEAQCWPREGDWQEPEICWSQLERIYPKILPYGVGDHWEMLRIRLQDIGRLPRECWDYGKNAFVIQGYQEYHYLVLIRDTKRNKCYLGVPGEDTMADPMVAAGFGFRDFRRGRQHGYWISGIRLGGENA